MGRARSEQRPTASPSAKKTKIEVRAGGGDQDAHVDDNEDKTLEEILDSLVLEDDHWSVSEEGGEDESKRVEELLARLRSDPEAKSSPAAADHSRDSGQEEDDDSEGEEMSRKVNDVLSRAMDEVNLENPGGSHEPSGPPDHNEAKAPKTDTDAADTTPEIHPGTGNLGPSLSAIPWTPTQDKSHLPDLPATPLDKDEDAHGADFRLPAVPTALRDPAPPSQAGDPFESSIAARLAALKGPGHEPIATDAFGLPSAPTFHPEDRSGAAAAAAAAGKGKLGSVAGYTDDDQKTWCVVCLDDATVCCAGCDRDVYCARCWREMHVGPAAGYDERGHQWEKFDPRVK